MYSDGLVLTSILSDTHLYSFGCNCNGQLGNGLADYQVLRLGFAV
jgi:alpha-tubulin suppressor-like RCC1 family protein